MMHALIRNDQIIKVGSLPRIWWDGDRWHDLREDIAYAESLGWHEVTIQPRPDDTATTTWDRNEPILVDGLPFVGWTERPWTEAELTVRAEAEQQKARYETHEAILDATAALMQQAHTDGEAWTQPTGAHDAVPLGVTVTDGGKTWRSKHHANVWPPSPSSPWWEEVTDNPGPQPWALDTYYFIDTRVTFGGQTWRCLHEHLAQVGWEPGAPGMHAVWTVG